jgi:hypothetical protein
MLVARFKRRVHKGERAAGSLYEGMGKGMFMNVICYMTPVLIVCDPFNTFN